LYGLIEKEWTIVGVLRGIDRCGGSQRRR
jgi:hypothetical protein